MSPAEVAATSARELEAHGHEEAGAAARGGGLQRLRHRDAPTTAERVLQVRLLLEAGEIEAGAGADGLPFSIDLHALPMLGALRGRKDFAALLRSRG